ncbi:hypothetical protein SLOPH_2345 [Spraguea lophii 42_110]|uniref:Uncharacterized protein n=1 Tax=Spraguea lophii (strain 42_110) TaxID=1358809 RepID=S7W5T9_SPRLO|nr:hypothetical protein SLOPH_2345 [Spraguea lophii 42_110]
MKVYFLSLFTILFYEIKNIHGMDINIENTNTLQSNTLSKIENKKLTNILEIEEDEYIEKHDSKMDTSDNITKEVYDHQSTCSTITPHPINNIIKKYESLSELPHTSIYSESNGDILQLFKEIHLDEDEFEGILESPPSFPNANNNRYRYFSYFHTFPTRLESISEESSISYSTINASDSEVSENIF